MRRDAMSNDDAAVPAMRRAALDPARHSFVDTKASSGAENRRCVVDVVPVIRSRDCSPQEFRAWAWGANNALRQAMDEKACWWHANLTDLAAIRGLTDSYAMLALKARDNVDGLRVPLELASELGARRAALLDEATTTLCAIDVRRVER